MAEDWDQFKLAPAAPGGGWEQFKRVPDTTRGGGYSARFSAAMAGNEADELARVQKYYPDAKRLADGQIVFIDPETKRPTMLNPKGLDLGDVVEAVPMVGEAAGGLLGGVAGFTAGGPPGAALGAAGGSIAARSALEMGQSLIGQPDTRPTMQRVRDQAVTAAGGAGGEMVGQLLGRAASALVKPTGRAIMDAADRFGIPITPGMVGREPIAVAEKTAESALLGSPAAAQGERTKAALDAARDSMVGQPTGQTAKEAAIAAGGALKEGAARRYDRFRALRQQIDDQVYDAIPAGVRLRLPSVQASRAELQQRIAEAPETMGPVLRPVVEQIDRVLSDAGGMGVSPRGLREIRTTIGRMVDMDPGVTQMGAAQQELRGLYGAINADLRSELSARAPRAAQLLQRHDRLVRSFRGEAADLGAESQAATLDKILKAGSDEQAYQAVQMGSSRRLRQALAGLNTDEVATVARATWERMATTPQGTPSYTRLVREWDAMPAESKRTLFGRVTDVEAIDDFMKVARGWNEREAVTNWSNTGKYLTNVGLAAGAYADPVATAQAYGSAWIATALLDNPVVARAIVRSPEFFRGFAGTGGRIVGQETSKMGME